MQLSFIQNCNDPLAAYMILWFCYGLIVTFKYTCCRKGSCHKKMISWQSAMEWDPFVRNFLVFYLPLSIGAMIQMMNYRSGASFFYKLGYWVAWLVFLTVIASIGFFYTLINRKRKMPQIKAKKGPGSAARRSHGDSNESVQILTHGFKSKKRLHKNFLLVILTQKFILAFSVVFLYDWPLLQIIVINTSNAVKLYLTSQRPYKLNN